HQLQHRDADDHAEGEPVALQLDELLDDDADPARPGKIHYAASTLLVMRWMNTSSRLGRALSQRIFPSFLKTAMACSSAAASSPVTCSVLPNAVTCDTPGCPFRRAFNSASLAGGPETSQ